MRKALTLGCLLLSSQVMAQDIQMHEERIWGEGVEVPLSFSIDSYWQKRIRQYEPDQMEMMLVFDHEVNETGGHHFSLGSRMRTWHTEGNVGNAYYRLENYGSAWAAMTTLEAVHYGTGATIGLNVEMERNNALGTLQGVVLQPRNGKADAGILFSSRPNGGYKNGLHIRSDAFGDTFINMEGKFKTFAKIPANTPIQMGNVLLQYDATRNCLLLTEGVNKRCL